MKHLERKSEEILKTNYEKSLAGEMNLISILTESRLELEDDRLDLSENLVSTINEDGRVQQYLLDIMKYQKINRFV